MSLAIVITPIIYHINKKSTVNLVLDDDQPKLP
jgi:hypothetical protein